MVGPHPHRGEVHPRSSLVGWAMSDDLWPFAKAASEAVWAGAVGDTKKAASAYRKTINAGEEVFFAAACGWASLIAPIMEEGQWVSTIVSGPPGEEREHMSDVAAFIAAVLNHDVDGVIALWKGLTIEQRVDLGGTIFVMACHALRPQIASGN